MESNKGFFVAHMGQLRVRKLGRLETFKISPPGSGKTRKKTKDPKKVGNGKVPGKPFGGFMRMMVYYLRFFTIDFQ